ncbi:hypothetical protein TrLO_g10337 [Triparma laevis f. longispina]|uniref:Uncharacterized protein n=1 Tax=Triparma laevis f. longispina TaxID=1714387 RepID=A0A9W7DQI3_9STRA|nr:hypothetical protein TrLO_g10337 [Triparma laevis f. longispina]
MHKRAEKKQKGQSLANTKQTGSNASEPGIAVKNETNVDTRAMARYATKVKVGRIHSRLTVTVRHLLGL